MTIGVDVTEEQIQATCPPFCELNDHLLEECRGEPIIFHEFGPATLHGFEIRVSVGTDKSGVVLNARSPLNIEVRYTGKHEPHLSVVEARELQRALGGAIREAQSMYGTADQSALSDEENHAQNVEFRQDRDRARAEKDGCKAGLRVVKATTA